jgi:imidazolonepropionase-like amidohydrolase
MSKRRGPRPQHLEDRVVMPNLMRFSLCVSFRALLCALLLLQSVAFGADTIILKAARLIDGRGGAPLAPATIVIVGDRITDLGSNIKVTHGAKIIDLGGATLLPGLIDLHTHLCGKYGVHWEDELVKTTPAFSALWGARNARVTLMAGFTTVRDMGTTWPYVDVELRNAINDGAIPGPRMFVAGAYLSSTGGAGDASQFSVYVQVPSVDNLADSPDEVVKQIRKNFKHGADFVKLLATGAVTSTGQLPGAQEFSDEEIHAAVGEANRWGRQVAVHAHGIQGIKTSIRAGVRTIDHGSFLDDEAIAMLKASNGKTFYVPTLYTATVIAREGREAGIPESEILRSKMITEAMSLAFKRALAAGIPIGFGTDAAVIPHGENAFEFLERSRLGEKPMDGIVSATRLNAEIMGWSDRVGSIEPGKFADIIAVAGDPRDNIEELTHVGFVMKGGIVYKDELNHK